MMRSVIISTLILAAIFALTITNSLYIGERIEYYMEAVEEDDGSLDYYERLFEDFKREEKFFGLTVSHDELFQITDAFSELARTEISSRDDVAVAKGRLQNALRHLHQLSELGIFSIL